MLKKVFKIMSPIAPSRFAIVSGIIWSLTSPLWGLWALAFISLVPLIYMSGRPHSNSYLIKEGLWTEIVFCTGTFFWAPHPLVTLSPKIAWLNISVFILLCLVSQLPVVFFPLVISKINFKKGTALKLVVSATVMAIADYLYPKPFNDTFGHAFINQSGLVSQIHFPHGTLLLTWLALLSNFAIGLCVCRKTYKRAAILWLALVLLVILIPTNRQGFTGHRPLEVVSVNLNLSVEEQLNSEDNGKSFKTIMDVLTSLPLARSGPRLVIFPETSYPYNILDAKLLANQQLEELIQSKDIHLLIGSRVWDGKGLFNAMVYLYAENGKVIRDYTVKRILFPFGESLPLLSSIPYFNKIFGTTYTPYLESPKLLHILGFKIATATCYESIFPSFVRMFSEQPDLVVNGTNEAYFSKFGEPDLSFAMTVFTSVENSVPIIRTSNSGMAGWIEGATVRDWVKPLSRVELKTYEIEL